MGDLSANLVPLGARQRKYHGDAGYSTVTGSQGAEAQVPRNLKQEAREERLGRRGRKSGPRIPRTLKIVFETLVGERIEIELRNDTLISGELVFVDDDLKCAPCQYL